MKYGEKEIVEFEIGKDENYWPNEHPKKLHNLYRTS